MTYGTSGLGGAAVVVPAHNEAGFLGGCLRSVLTAATCLPFPTQIVTVLDNCDDDSAKLASRFGSDVHFVEINARNVGAARAVGFAYTKSIGRVDEGCLISSGPAWNPPAAANYQTPQKFSG